MIGEEEFWFSQKLDKKCFPTPYRLSRSSFWVLRSLIQKKCVITLAGNDTFSRNEYYPFKDFMLLKNNKNTWRKFRITVKFFILRRLQSLNYHYKLSGYRHRVKSRLHRSSLTLDYKKFTFFLTTKIPLQVFISNTLFITHKSAIPHPNQQASEGYILYYLSCNFRHL